MYLVVGLGNPGRKYEKTKHNAGFMAVDFLVGKRAQWREEKKAKAKSLEINFEGREIKFLKPETYMNNSGIAVAQIAKKNNIKPENIIVIYDELDLEFGKLKVKEKGSSAGHNGIKSIIEHVGNENFWRIRIGISNERREKIPAEKFVLKKFSRKDIEKLNEEIFPEVQEKLKEIIK